MNPLLDRDFLKQLDNFNNREIYARITALDIDEYPLELIQGKVTGGSVNIDGASALRRTCSVSLIAEDVNINEFYWGLNNKFKLEIGLKNFIDSKYPDIIWFPQGLFIITSFNSNLASNTYSISINGKDKMCKLNGEFGGSLPASIDFGAEDYYDFKANVLTRTKIPIKKIIREMVHTYACEPYHNIIINDLDEYGLELLEYRGNVPLYLLYDIAQGEYTQMLFNGKQQCYINGVGESTNLESINYNKRIDWIDENDEATIITLKPNGEKYTVSKIEYGDTAGYRLTDLTYPGDLISGIGESITSILDKIVGMLGNFEYFYDLYGRFIFQSKKTYLNVSWNSIINSKENIYVENAVYAEKASYSFDGNNIVKSLSNTPNLSNVKNDYIIWGSRKGVSGAEIPIHMRYAIHKKPKQYTNYNGTKTYKDNEIDWREIIYQMALDYYANNTKDDYLSKIAQNNPVDYPTGITGYESFYLDFQGFWRELYNPEVENSYKIYSYTYDDNKQFSTNENLYINEQYDKITSAEQDINIRNKVLVFDKVNLKFIDLIDTIPISWEEDKYYVYLNNEYKSVNENSLSSIDKKILYVKKNNEIIPLIKTAEDNENYVWYLKNISDEIKPIPSELESLYKNKNNYNKYYIISKNGVENRTYINYYYNDSEYYDKNSTHKYWNKKLQETPDLINFWIDFLDTGEENSTLNELSKMSIFAIGSRPKVINDKNVKSIYYRNVPNVIYAKQKDITLSALKEKTGYIFMNLVEGVFNSDCFSISSQGKSAKDSLDDLLYQHSYCTESINVQAIPVYYLEPNTIISIEDKDTKINGEYILNKITIPLTYNGMMSIQATKSPQRIY